MIPSILQRSISVRGDSICSVAFNTETCLKCVNYLFWWVQCALNITIENTVHVKFQMDKLRRAQRESRSDKNGTSSTIIRDKPRNRHFPSLLICAKSRMNEYKGKSAYWPILLVVHVVHMNLNLLSVIHPTLWLVEWNHHLQQKLRLPQ